MSKNLRTIIYNGINGLEQFDLYIDTATISAPAKRENKQSVPYRSGSYNMDKTVGHPTYDDREIVYTCQLIEDSTRDLELLLTEIDRWLMVPVEAVLQDTGTPDYHYKGECTGVVPASNERGFCEVTITFKLYPFKIWNTEENDWEWDVFNFNSGIVPQTEFTLAQGGSIEIYNPSANFITFIPHHEMYKVRVTVDNVTYTLASGTESPFLLVPGNNTISITELETGGASNVMTITMIREGL